MRWWGVDIGGSDHWGHVAELVVDLDHRRGGAYHSAAALDRAGVHCAAGLDRTDFVHVSTSRILHLAVPAGRVLDDLIDHVRKAKRSRFGVW